MRRLPAVLAALVPALATARLPPPPEPPARIELHGRTIFLSPEQTVAGVGDGWQLLQFLEISGRDLTLPGLSVHSSVWGGGDFDTENRDGGSAAVGDVDLLFVRYADPRGRYEARLGRQLILGGAAPAFYGQMDGGYLRGTTGLLEGEAFGGLTVVRAFDDREGDWVGGGRIGLRRAAIASGGVSFLYAGTNGRVGREVLGADLTLRPVRLAELVASAAYDLIDPGLAETRALLRAGPVQRLSLIASVEQGSPGRLVNKSSIFSVFSLGDWAQAQMEVEYAVTPQWRVSGRYARVFFPDDDGTGLGGAANLYGASVTTLPLRGLYLTLEGNRLPSEDNAYDSVRLAARYDLDRSWVFTADLLAYFYDGPPLPAVSDTTETLVAQLFAQRRIVQGFSVGVAAAAGSTVFESSDFRGTLLATQDLDVAWGGGK